jgi:TAT (twin-arginine translocation) pathway signal sequence
MKMRNRDLSRRNFLLGSSAAAAGVLLIPCGPSGMVSRARLAAATPTPIRGATVAAYVYGTTNWVKAARTFDSYVRMPLATKIQKIYMHEGQYYTDPLPPHIAQLAAIGCQFIVCVYPSRTNDDSQKLATFLRLLNSKGIVYRAALVNEWNSGTKFATPQAYLNYWHRYAPVVKAAGVPLCNLVCATCIKSNYDKIQPGFPTSPLPDQYWIDYYATGYRFKVRLDTSGGLLDQAENHGVPVGIAEFGWSAGGGSLTMEQWNNYCSYLVRLAPRLQLGCLYWGDPGRTGEDTVTSANDPKIPGIRQVMSAF